MLRLSRQLVRQALRHLRLRRVSIAHINTVIALIDRFQCIGLRVAQCKEIETRSCYENACSGLNEVLLLLLGLNIG